MKNLTKTLLFLGLIVFSAGCQQQEITPKAVLEDEVYASEKANEMACWGQATTIFAKMGVMGEHASQQPTPRLGLRNLALALYEAGVIPDDSMEALGAFVTSELGLSIDACE